MMMQGVEETSLLKDDHNPPTPTIPTWAQSEIGSSQSAPQQIPSEEHGRIFSWSDVKQIIGMHLENPTS